MLGSVDRVRHAPAAKRAGVVRAAPPTAASLSGRMARVLTRWNAAMSLFHAALLVATWTVGNLGLEAVVQTLRLNVSIPDEDLANATVEYVRDRLSNFLVVTPEASETPLPVTVLVGLFFLLSAAFHFGNAVLWNASYLRGIANQSCGSRWVEYFFSASVMIVVIAYTAGVVVDVELAAVAALIATTMSFGLLTEFVNEAGADGRWTRPLRVRLVPHVLGYVPFVVAWAIVLDAFLPNRANAPDFVTGIVASQVVLFASFGAVQLVVIVGPPSRYVYGELAYQTLSLVSKGLLGGILIANVVFLDTWPCVVPEVRERLPDAYC